MGAKPPPPAGPEPPSAKPPPTKRVRDWKRPPLYEAPPPPPAGTPLALAAAFVTALRDIGLADGFTPYDLARRAHLDPAVDAVTRAFLGTTDERRLDRALNRRLGLEVLGRRLERTADMQGFALRPVRSASETGP